MSKRLEAVVIGTGFGGSVCACRLSKKWPGQVLVLERGKRYPKASFPRSPHDVARNFWTVSEDGAAETAKAAKSPGVDEQLGMYDVRGYEHMDVLLAAGLGGGSLIYANVILEAPEEVFDDRWPVNCRRSDLEPYYRVIKEVLAARPIPLDDDPRRKVVRTELFQKVARDLGRDSRLLDLAVFFGNDFEKPLPIGEQDRNRYGAIQDSCVYCAECCLGCNTHSKNTLDLNYLFVAEHRYHADIRTEHLAVKIVPVDAAGEDSSTADGSSGYRVYYRDLAGSGELESAITNRVVVSSGALGSTELLLRCRNVYQTLPRVSSSLGCNYSGNGDFLSFVVDGKFPSDPNYGPVITQAINFNLLSDFKADRAFVMEDASFPALISWFVEGVKPGFLRLQGVSRWLRDAFSRWTGGRKMGAAGWAFSDLLSRDLSYNSSVLLCMGVDKSDGVMTLDKGRRLAIEWPYRNSMTLYDAIVRAGRDFSKSVRAKGFLPLPTWSWPFRRNVTVHSLGGCILAESAAKGVTSADPDSFGQVFGYHNLYVADGAILPTAVGSNPAATIAALSERVAQGITGIEPDADL